MTRVSHLFAAAMASVLAIGTLSPLHAHDYTVGNLHIVHPWSRATPPGAKVAVGFLKIENKGTTPDRLIGGSLPAAGRFEVHTMTMDGGVMIMRQLDKGLEIPAGQTVELKPGSYHLMFMELKEGFKDGDRVKGTLVFEKAGTIEVDYKIEPVGAKASGDSHASHDMTHGAGHAGHGTAAQPKKTP